MWLDEPREAALRAFRGALTSLCGDLLEEPQNSDIVFVPPRIGRSTCIIATLVSGAPVARREVSMHELGDVLALLSGLCRRELHWASPVLDVVLPDGGERVHATVPPATIGPHMTIRKPYPGMPTLDDLASGGMMTSGQLSLLRRYANDQDISIVVSGMVNSGKTTLMRSLMTESRFFNAMPVICQDPLEFQPPPPLAIPLNADPFGEGGLSLEKLVADGLREPGSSLSVGETRRGEIINVVSGWNAGYKGLTTVHAPNARAVPSRIAQMYGMGGAVVDEFQRAAIATSIDVVVHVARDEVRKPRITEIVMLESWDDKIPKMRDLSAIDV
jgi:Flp pilus assembly CpaF family ATPase